MIFFFLSKWIALLPSPRESYHFHEWHEQKFMDFPHVFHIIFEIYQIIRFSLLSNRFRFGTKTIPILSKFEFVYSEKFGYLHKFSIEWNGIIVLLSWSKPRFELILHNWNRSKRYCGRISSVRVIRVKLYKSKYLVDVLLMMNQMSLSASFKTWELSPLYKSRQSFFHTS